MISWIQLVCVHGKKNAEKVSFSICSINGTHQFQARSAKDSTQCNQKKRS